MATFFPFSGIHEVPFEVRIPNGHDQERRFPHTQKSQLGCDV